MNDEALIPASDAKDATSPIEFDDDWLSNTNVVFA